MKTSHNLAPTLHTLSVRTRVKLLISTDGPSLVHSGRPLFSVAPPMRCLDIVRVVVSPRSAHPFGIPVVWNDVVIVGEFFVADRTYSGLFPHLSVHQLSHFSRRSQFPIAARVVRIIDSLHSQSYESGFGKGFAATARRRSVKRAKFFGTESHAILQMAIIESVGFYEGVNTGEFSVVSRSDSWR